MFCYKNKVLVTHLLVFSSNKNEREISLGSHSFFTGKKKKKKKKSNKGEWENPKDGNAVFFYFRIKKWTITTISMSVENISIGVFRTESNIHDIIFFTKIVTDLNLWSIFTKNFIIDVWHGSKYVTGIQFNIQFMRALTQKQMYYFF